MKGKTMLMITASRPQMSNYKEIGRGGEAVIHLLKEDTVAKVFIRPTDPQFSNSTELQAAATERFETIQKKLFELPDDLPQAVITPTALLTNNQEKIFGYIMPMVLNGRPISEIKKPHPKLACKILSQLYDLISVLHQKDIVIGDVSENNILIDDHDMVRLIDTDSMQFSSYVCTTFTPRYTPPEVLDTSNNMIHLVKTRDKLSDWYGFAVIAMRLFTNTDPYGGVMKGMNLPQRIENHVTVFNPEVIYPATAVPLSIIPRPIIELFFEIFHKKSRIIPDRSLFEYKDEYASCIEQPVAPISEPAATKKRTRKYWGTIDIDIASIADLKTMLDEAETANKPRKAQAIRNVLATRTGTPAKPLVYVDLVCKHPYCSQPNWRRVAQRGRQPHWCDKCQKLYGK